MITCPNCGKSHYVQHYSTTTALGWVQEYKNGIPLNSNPNVSTTYCTCCECNHDFFYTEQYGEVQEIVDKGEHPEVPVLEVPFTVPNESESLQLRAEDVLVKSEHDKTWVTIPSDKRIEKLEESFNKLMQQFEELKEMIYNVYSKKKM